MRTTCFVILSLVAFAAGLLPLPAYAAGETLYNVFLSLSKNFIWLPRVMAMLCYVGGAALTMLGLLSLKTYGDDPTSIPLRSVVMKFVLAALLISLPLSMELFITTVVGTKSKNAAITARPTALGNSNLMTIRPK